MIVNKFYSERIAQNLYVFPLPIGVILLRSKQELYANTHLLHPKTIHYSSIRTVPRLSLSLSSFCEANRNCTQILTFVTQKPSITPAYEQYLAPQNRCHPFAKQTGTVRQYLPSSSKIQQLLHHTNSSSPLPVAVILLRSKEELYAITYLLLPKPSITPAYEQFLNLRSRMTFNFFKDNIFLASCSESESITVTLLSFCNLTV
ncbi:hypothetical protein [Sphingobacterium mizutaii]|uniref:hypothetical protein n=1 Tax=Sphingobacterium mizutaii TaxID=1010 RepID=UPI0016247FF2|nr:hypothetical protein [Sphingobacterium mizutaii]